DKLKIKNKSLHWDNNDQSELNKICEEIKRQPLLHYPDLKKSFQLKSDASDIGIGSMLLQEGKVVGFYSRKLRGSEKNYTIMEKETFAILEAFKHFKTIIFGSKIIIMTDNKNLTFKGDLSKRMNRWLLILEEFDYEIRHIMGTNNNEAHFLSRSMMIKCNEFKRKNSLEIITKCIVEIKKYIDNSKSLINTQILVEKNETSTFTFSTPR
ncbi:Retrovirus-related Pol polyprotein from transposon 17.6, partial [Dictyocoela muelleri]